MQWIKEKSKTKSFMINEKLEGGAVQKKIYWKCKTFNIDRQMERMEKIDF